MKSTRPLQKAASKPAQNLKEKPTKKDDEFTFDYLMTVINSKMGDQPSDPL